MKKTQDRAKGPGRDPAEDLADLKARAAELPGVTNLLQMHDRLSGINRAAMAYTIRNGRVIGFTSSDRTS